MIDDLKDLNDNLEEQSPISRIMIAMESFPFITPVKRVNTKDCMKVLKFSIPLREKWGISLIEESTIPSMKKSIHS